MLLSHSFPLCIPFTDVTEVYDKLKHCSPHMNVYLKEDIPARFHYQQGDRIQPIILVADEGWTIVLNKSSLKCKYFICGILQSQGYISYVVTWLWKASALISLCLYYSGLQR